MLLRSLSLCGGPIEAIKASQVIILAGFFAE